MRFWGAEMMLEIARFWSSAAVYDHELDRYEIKGVMGPDEYHERYPWSDDPGLDNNAYTNVMAVWCLLRAFDALEALRRAGAASSREARRSRRRSSTGGATSPGRCGCASTTIASSASSRATSGSRSSTGPRYREKYGNIQRLDRILEAEGDTPNRYQLTKQPDTLMLFYLFSTEELVSIFDRLGYEFDADVHPAEHRATTRRGPRTAPR